MNHQLELYVKGLFILNQGSCLSLVVIVRVKTNEDFTAIGIVIGENKDLVECILIHKNKTNIFFNKKKSRTKLIFLCYPY